MSKAAPFDAGDYGSEFDSESDSERKRKKKKREEEVPRKKHKKHEVASKDVLKDEYEKDERIRHAIHFRALNGYDRHKQLVNNYLMYYGGRNADFTRDASSDKRDIDVIRENHQFLWDEDEDGDDEEGSRSWERNLAKKYWDKLYKEYCICDLSRYKENKVAMRWRVEKEVVDGKGQFTCGNRKCKEREGMKTWEVNFAYLEHGDKKNALVKVRLCPDCSYKLNYHSKKREIKKEKKMKKEAKRRRRKKNDSDDDEEDDDDDDESGSAAPRDVKGSGAGASDAGPSQDPATHWKGPAPKIDEDKSKDEEFEDYLEDLFM